MKKSYLIILSLLVAGLSYSSYGQVQKSDKNLGFGFDVSSLGGDAEESRTNMFFSYTHFISNRVSLGFGPRFGWNTTTDASGEESKNNTIGYNFNLNYSFVSDNGFALPYLGLQYTNLRQKQEGNDDPFVTTSIGGNIGIRFFVTERLNIDNNFSITRIISNNDALDEFGFDVDGTVLQLNVGLGYIVGRKN